jgi:hypothetical protein
LIALVPGNAVYYLKQYTMAGETSKATGKATAKPPTPTSSTVTPGKPTPSTSKRADSDGDNNMDNSDSDEDEENDRLKRKLFEMETKLSDAHAKIHQLHENAFSDYEAQNLKTKIAQMEAMLGQFSEVQGAAARKYEEQFDRLYDERETTTDGRREVGAVVKAPKPRPFDGSPGKLQGFITSLKAYFQLFKTTFVLDKDRVMFAAQLLEGRASVWFEPTLRDYVNNPSAMRKEETELIFTDFETFAEQIRKTFGVTDETREAERELDKIRQIGSMSSFVATFRQTISRIDWPEAVFKKIFYDKVKEEIKDELIKIKREETTLEKYFHEAILIDERLWERKMERRGHGANRPVYQANTQKPQHERYAVHGTHADPWTST